MSTVCDRVRSVLVDQDKENDNSRLLPILATLVRDGGQLEAALKKIKAVKGKFICKIEIEEVVYCEVDKVVTRLEVQQSVRQ